MNKYNTYLRLAFNGASEVICTKETVNVVLEKLKQASENNTSVKFYCVDKKEHFFISPNNVPSITVVDTRPKQ